MRGIRCTRVTRLSVPDGPHRSGWQHFLACNIFWLATFIVFRSWHAPHSRHSMRKRPRRRPPKMHPNSPVLFLLFRADEFEVHIIIGPLGWEPFIRSPPLTTRLGPASHVTNRPDKRQAGRRPVFGGAQKFQNDPYWRDHLLFYEYFHGDNGAGIGASHQTGWTGVVASLIEIFGHLDAQTYLEHGREAAFEL